MKKIFASIILLLTMGFYAYAQDSISDEKEAVKAVIVTLFDAMRAGDSTRLSKVFHSEARLQTTLQNLKTGETALRTEEISSFITQVGTAHPEPYDEQIMSYEIAIDGALATAWTPYRFYVGEKFSHCGVNAFQLFKSKEGWKIIQITDTRRREGCEEDK